MRKKKREFAFPGIFVDIETIIEKDDKNRTSTYYRLIFMNTFQDGISIDLDSSNIQNTPATILDY